MPIGIPGYTFASPVTSYQDGMKTGNALQAQQMQLQQERQQQQDQNQLRQLAPDALYGTGDTQTNALRQVAGIDPAQAVRYGQYSQEAQQQVIAQAQAKAGQVAQQLISIAAVPSGPQREAAWQAQLDQEQAAGQDVSHLRSLPADQGIKQVYMTVAKLSDAAKVAGIGPQHGVVINGSLVNDATGDTMYAGHPNMQYQSVPTGQMDANGNPIMQAGGFNPQSGQITPITMGGSQPMGAMPPTQSMAPKPTPEQLMAQASAMANQGGPGANSDQAQAWLMSNMQKNGYSLGAPSGAPMQTSDPGGTGVSVGMGGGGNQLATSQTVANQPLGFGQSVSAAKGGNFTQMTPDEVKQAGLPIGTVAQKGANGKIDVVSKPDANSSSIAAPGDGTKTGEDYLQTIPASMRPLVRAIASGNQAPPSASSRSPEAQALLQAVYAFDPTASASNLPTRTATRKSFSPGGKDAANMTALSQLGLHLDHLNNQVDSVSGLPLPNFVNGAINSVTDKTSGTTTAFDSSANAVAHELRAVFANAGGGTEAELEQNLKQLDSSNSTAQKKAAIQNIAQLVHGRFGILQDKYSQGMGKVEDPFSSAYPGAESTILRLSGASPAQSSATPPAAGGWSIQRVQ